MNESTPTISLRERSFPAVGSEDRLRKWFAFSLLLHMAFDRRDFFSRRWRRRTRHPCRFTPKILSAAKRSAAQTWVHS